MLYHILYPVHQVYSWLNVFKYITFRAMVAFLFSFAFVLIAQPIFIRKLQSRGVKGQPIRDDVKLHGGKKGTPTMGGLVIVMSVVFSTLLLADLTNFYIWLTLLVLVAFAALGFVDDWRKINQQNTKGLSGRSKLVWQSGIAASAGFALWLTGFDTSLNMPFFKEASFDLGFFFLPFMMLVVVGASNAVNLTDGLDGLAIGPVMTVAGTYAIFAYLIGHKNIATYLGFTHIAGTGEISIVLAAILAAGLGFLWYNTFPAQVFMGDTGSLALGGTLGFIAVLVKHELLLVIAGGVFVAEALSVIVQVYSFKMTGKRVFRMAPLHHHFELLGWAEPKIIVRAWIVSIVLALLTLTSLKLR